MRFVFDQQDSHETDTELIIVPLEPASGAAPPDLKHWSAGS
jgi:hypothetical protein